MNSALVSFGSLVLAFASLLLKAAMKILVVMLVLWIVGTIWPYMADALGMPYGTVYDFYLGVVSAIKDMVAHTPSGVPAPTAIPLR